MRAPRLDGTNSGDTAEDSAVLLYGWLVNQKLKAFGRTLKAASLRTAVTIHTRVLNSTHKAVWQCRVTLAKNHGEVVQPMHSMNH